MYGYHDAPLKIEKERIAITVERDEENLVYKRKLNDETVEKILLMKSGKILINPIEPLHKPKELTHLLLIELEKPILAQPKSKKTIFLTFPIEVGVFVLGEIEFKSLDIFTFNRQKLTLYGEVRGGFICKHWKSDVHSSIPSPNPITEGVVELTINNTTPRWHEITQIVFNAYGMKIYYNKKFVTMKASMKIMLGGIAEVEFFDSPIRKKMTKALELYTARKLQIVTGKFVMEWGL